MDYKNLDEFVNAIKETKAYKLAKEAPIREYNLTFDQC